MNLRFLLVAAAIALGAALAGLSADAQVGPGPTTPVTPATTFPVSPATTFPVNAQATIANALATPSAIPSLSAVPQAISTASGGHILYHLGIENNQATSANVYIQLYNLAPGSITTGMTAPVYELFCPAPTQSQQCVFPFLWLGFPFPNNTGFSITATTTSVWGGGNTSPAAGVTGYPLYK